MALRAGIRPVDARELLRLHRWSQESVSSAVLAREMKTVFGWRCAVTADFRPPALMNFPMQANGAEMMRVAAIAATESGIEVSAPVHDAFLIAAPLNCFDEHVAEMQSLMRRAGSEVTGGVEIRTDAEVVRWPERYMDDRGRDMWQRVTSTSERRF